MGKTLTVSQLNTYIKGVFDDELILQGINVTGEIFEFRTAGGNSYITLKDGDCVLNCVYFSSVVEYNAGQRVQLGGSVRFYQKSGKVSFIVSYIKIIGRGEILLALEKTREKLSAEGVFSNNRQLPALVTRVAFITSEDGAVVHDFASVVSRIPYLCVVLFPVRVQGLGAANEIIDIMSDIGKGLLPKMTTHLPKSAENPQVKQTHTDNAVSDIDWEFREAVTKKTAAITCLDETERDFDVVVIARGGGSSSDLCEFNNESLARAVHASKVPVISAIGHETDYTLCDFAADIRAGTPSLAAEIIAANNREFFERLTDSIHYIAAKTEQILEGRLKRISAATDKTGEQVIERIYGAINKTIYSVSRNQGLVDMLLHNCDVKIKSQAAAILGALKARADTLCVRLGVLSARTEQLNPLRILEKGYAKISKGSEEIGGVSRLDAGDVIELIMSDGRAVAVVESAKLNSDKR